MDCPRLSPIAWLLGLVPALAGAGVNVTIVQGLSGGATYEAQFSAETAAIGDALGALADEVTVFAGSEARRERILAHWQQLAESGVNSDDGFAVFLIGHGSFDGLEYKFNLPGPDLTDADLRDSLDALGSAPQLLVNTSSASGALLEKLAQESRTVITATRSGSQRNAPQFGRFFAAALTEPAADLNKDARVNAREAFDYASRQVADWFEFENRLVTEHPQLVGARAEHFVLAGLGAQADNPPTRGLAAARSRVESEIAALQGRRGTLSQEDYFEQLEKLLLELARLEEESETGATP